MSLHRYRGYYVVAIGTSLHRYRDDGMVAIGTSLHRYRGEIYRAYRPKSF